MSLLIATPMFGGHCTEEYFQSCLALRGVLLVSGVDHTWLTESNESLITRGRNSLVARFMRDPDLDYERFMFIDADIKFIPDDVQKLWNLDVDVAVGAYPMKREGSWVSAWIDGKLTDRGDLEQLTDPVVVDYAGTGFMMIKRSVFETLQKFLPHTRHIEGVVGESYALFDTALSESKNGWEERFYYSEDYLFCDRCKKAGIEVTLDPTIRLGHVGRQVYC